MEHSAGARPVSAGSLTDPLRVVCAAGAVSHAAYSARSHSVACGGQLGTSQGVLGYNPSAPASYAADASGSDHSAGT